MVDFISKWGSFNALQSRTSGITNGGNNNILG